MTDDNLDDTLIENIDPKESAEYIKNYLEEKQKELSELPDDADENEKALLNLDIAEAMVGVGQEITAWDVARSAFDIFMAEQDWQNAVKCCDVLYQTSQPASLTALGQGVWLAVTYPIDPQLSVNMLSYIVDETPGKADGAAVAAIVAHYIADVRATGKQHESLTFLTKEMVANVAKAHSDVDDQEAMSAWMEKLELHDPDVFLPRLSLVIGAIVTVDQWWFDRDELRKAIEG